MGGLSGGRAGPLSRVPGPSMALHPGCCGGSIGARASFARFAYAMIGTGA